MATVQQHYHSHLGAIYGWMIGDFETAKEAARTELQAVGISSGAGRIAIDLGAGPDVSRTICCRCDVSRLCLEDARRPRPLHSGPQDDSRILTCFLEYSATSVTVHDLLHERTSAGWTRRVSSYPKLRLNPEWARAALERLGLAASLEAGPRGMTRLVARCSEVSSTGRR
jgi:hypothetical protein